MSKTVTRKLDSLADNYRGKSEVSELKILLVDSKTGFRYQFNDSGTKSQHLIASSTKMMVASVLQQLVDEGRLDFSEPIAKYLPRFDFEKLNVFEGRDFSHEIRVRDIVAQSSGIADYYQLKRLPQKGDLESASKNDPGWSFEEAIELARSLPAKFPPNSQKANYSATNYQLVGRLIEQITGSSLDKELQKRIFEPLGMKHSELLTMNNLESFDQASQVLIGKQKYLGARRIASVRAEGAVISTLEDCSKFLQGFFSGELLNSASRENLMNSWLRIFPAIRYGSGVMTLNLPRIATRSPHSVGLVGHSGATGHLMFYDPVQSIHLILTINQLRPSLLPYRLLSSTLRILNSR
jgi:D-alanyl-D-alanine carboxypeptidase